MEANSGEKHGRQAGAVRTNGVPRQSGVRKDGAKRYYAVRIGRKPGVFPTWDEARRSIDGFPGAVYRRFGCPQQARAYVEGPTLTPPLVATVQTSRMCPVMAAATGADTGGSRTNKADPKYETATTTTTTSAATPIQINVSVLPPTNQSSSAFRYGVYWGPGDPRNEAGKLPEDTRCERRAALYALGCAARALARDQWAGPADLCTDSSQGIMWARDYMPSWRRNDWTTARGVEPTDMDVLRPLADALDKCAGAVRFVHRLRIDRSLGISAARRLALGLSPSN